ncbi:hypothetical protein BDF14DRAFT_1781653 [Spinellus fusiger]|nr:hypothetical protein BDF14DRAFT_1781653 [Spinellus fusiger]
MGIHFKTWKTKDTLEVFPQKAMPCTKKKPLSSQPAPLAFYRLSNELILYILQQPTIDLKTLYTMSRLSKRFHSLAICALKVYRLPHIRLMVGTDQEGRGKATTCFRFQSLDSTHLTATFVATTLDPKRYCRNKSKEPPILRHISMTDSDQDTSGAGVARKHRRVRRQPSWMTMHPTTFHERALSPHTVSRKQECTRLPHSMHSADTPIDILRPSRTRQLNVKEAGFHILQSQHRRVLPIQIHSNVKPSWRLAYHVGESRNVGALQDICPSMDRPDSIFTRIALQSKMQKKNAQKKKETRHECYVCPVVLTLDISLLCRGEESQCLPPLALAMGWIRDRCHYLVSSITANATASTTANATATASMAASTTVHATIHAAAASNVTVTSTVAPKKYYLPYSHLV